MIKIAKLLKLLALFTAMLIWSPTVMAQSKPPKAPNEKQQYKAQAKKEKQSKKADEKAKKQYKKRQSKQSKKNMKNTKKKSDRQRKSKGTPFWEGWFIKR
ncbi:MAG: hypothetical protein DRJ07_16675 [Bacteroidetes bacterium]|nr:MAG: hypothetical protein DRJ07_16675 [Bacteroidota bacterium]